jgi:PBS lyase HEAT-like repeat
LMTGKVKGFGGKRISGQKLNWDRAEAVPTLVQMLQPEGEALRLLLVELLSEIKGKDAGIGLARRAMFDLSPEVREKAVEALANRPRDDYEQTLIDGLRWPWAPAADHAGEALGALKQKDAVPALVKVLKESDPSLAYLEGKTHFMKEMVRINHLSNCTLCHGLSTSKQDLVRGRIPTPGKDMPPLYYADTTGLFIRADMTFLKQDFSVVQPVTNPSKWPGQQRYDYLLRTRKATTKEIQLLKGLEKDNKLADPYPQRDAVIFALKGITGLDRGNRPESWMDLLNPIRDGSK